MKIKSLLLGSAAASMLAVSGAQAADPIIYAEPEAMEYVRICDVYGAGFFYIPGTETCLRVSGHARFQVQGSSARNAYSAAVSRPQARTLAIREGLLTPAEFDALPADTTFGVRRVAAPRTYSSIGRLELNFDSRSETEYGTLQGFVRVVGEYTSGSLASPGRVTGLGTGYNQILNNVVQPGTWGHTGAAGGTHAFTVDHAYIALGGLRVGKTDTIFTRELNYGAGGIYGGSYGFFNDNEVSLTYTNAGFTIAGSMVENHDGRWEPDFQGVISYRQGTMFVGGGVAYDNVNNAWAVKLDARTGIPNLGGTVGVQVYYASGQPWYGNASYNRYGTVSPATGFVVDWSAMAHATLPVSAQLDVKGSVQWYNEAVGNDTWQLIGGLNWRPVSGLEVRPEIRYTTNVRQTEFALRFQRNF